MSGRNDYWDYLRYTGDYLMHHGVKGMKWGVRKRRDPADTKRASRVPKMRVDSYSSAGYRSDGTRSYTSTGVDKKLMSEAKKRATMMLDANYKNWRQDPNAKGLYNTYVGEIYDEMYYKGK